MGGAAVRCAVEFSETAHRLVTSAPAGAPVLALDGITRRFGSVRALDQASLHVRPGTVHALLGENGAGKTTLMRIVFGLVSPDAGTIVLRGKPIQVSSPAAALAQGIGMVHQHFTLVPAMTVAENVVLGDRGRFDPSKAADRVRDVAARAGLAIDPDALVSSLSVAAQQRCEIVKAVARDVSLLILDEPTAVLAPAEAADLLRWMREYADAGHAVVLITHKLRDALSVADDVTVLRNGRTVLSAAAAETTQDALRLAMVGDDRADVPVGDSSASSKGSSGNVVLALRDASYTDGHARVHVRGATMEVHAGEIVGIAAVEGAGHHALLRLLAGRLEATTGSVQRPPSLGFVPEDRHRDALMLDAPLDENIALRDAGMRRGGMAWPRLRDATASIIARSDVRSGGVRVPARTLSGGNQQKFVLGRELADAPEAVVAENPSRGLDFQATTAVHDALRAARAAGAAIVVYSSDLDEVLQLSDRVFAMYNGQLVGTPRDRDAIGRAMLGVT